jgi:hypothetical protein
MASGSGYRAMRSDEIHVFVWFFSSVSDPGCLFRIPDPNFYISDPGSKRSWIPAPDPHKRNQVFLTQKIVFKISEISGMFIPDPDCFPIPDPGVKKHRIIDPDPQH